MISKGTVAVRYATVLLAVMLLKTARELRVLYQNYPRQSAPSYWGANAR